jgi:hypothetical protein
VNGRDRGSRPSFPLREDTALPGACAHGRPVDARWQPPSWENNDFNVCHTTYRPMVCFYLHVPSWVAGSKLRGRAGYALEFVTERG